MKVLYDHQIFTWQKYGGISRYFYELMKHSNNLFEYDVSGIYSDNEYAKILKLKEFPLKFNFKGKMRLINYINKINSMKKIKYENYDIIHPTYYDPYILKINNNNQPVFDVHNIVPKKMSVHYNKKDDILLNNNNVIPEKKENVMYRNDLSQIKKIKQNTKKEDYILFTGQRYEYKNFKNFIKAVAPLLIRYNLRFICTGQDFTKNEIILLNKYKIQDRTISKYVFEEELQDIYAKALIFVFPSLYEGFGFPILEAFASGCPAVLSNTSCFPEIAEDAAIYFDPYSVEDMREKIKKVLLDSDLQTSLIEKGYERVKFFSWEKTVKQTFQLYSDVLYTPSPYNKTRYIITVFDMIHENFSECFTNKDKTISNKYLVMRKANKIITISKNTKMDIIKYYPDMDDNKIEVIYLGTSFNRRSYT